MTGSDETRWRKSSFSDNATQCVELAPLHQAFGVRDSKNPAPVLTFPVDQFAAFLQAL